MIYKKIMRFPVFGNNFFEYHLVGISIRLEFYKKDFFIPKNLSFFL